MGSFQRRWLVLLGGHPSVSGLDVVFVPERSRVARVELENLRSDQRSESAGRLVSLLFPEIDVDTGFIGLLTVTFEEDAPVIAAISWESAKRPRADVFSLALPLDAFLEAGFLNKDAKPTEGKADLVSFFWRFMLGFGIPIDIIRPEERGQVFEPYSTVDVFVVRRQAMENDARARAFFLGLDAGTIAEDVPEEWRATMEAVNGRLAVRVEERSLAGARSEVPLWGRSARFARQLVEASMFVQALMLTHLYQEVGDDLVDWAFQRFAVDALAVSHRDPVQHGRLQSHGAPDGVAFFRFAELALACIDHGVHPQFWKRHLGSLVKSAHVYAEHGWELAETGNPPKYVYAFRENRRFPLRRLRILAEECRAPARVDELAFFQDHFTSIVAQAFSVDGSTAVLTRPLIHRARVERQETSDSRANTAREFAERAGLFGLLASL